MEKIVFDDRISDILTDSSRIIITRDGYVGQGIYKINLIRGERKSNSNEYFLYAMADKTLICIKDIRTDLDEFSAKRMLGEIIKKLRNSCEIIPSMDIELVANPDAEAKNVEQPVVLRIVTSYELCQEDKLSKMMCNDLIDWLDELTVMKSLMVSEKEKETYHQEYEKIMSANLIPHEDSEIKNYSTTMAILTLTITVLGIFIRSMCVIPVIAMVASFFSGYRCFANKNKVCGIICIVCGIIAVICAYFGWTEFMAGFGK